MPDFSLMQQPDHVDRGLVQKPKEKKTRKYSVKLAPEEWARYRKRFVEGGEKLSDIAKESEGTSAEVSYQTLHRRSESEGWIEQRRNYLLTAVNTGKVNPDSLREVNDHAALLRLQDFNEAIKTIERHIKIAQEFQNYFMTASPLISEAIHQLDLDTLARTDPRGFIASVKDWASIVTTVTELERKSRGISDPAKLIDVSSLNKVEEATLEQILDSVDTKKDSELVQEYLSHMIKVRVDEE